MGTGVDFQTGFNVALTLVGALGGFILKSLWDDLKALRAADKALTEKVQAIEVLVAGQYVQKDDLDRVMNAIFAKLDRIEDKLDGKADK